MTVTLRIKEIENENKSLYLDIYENGKRKFEFLSLYLYPEIDAATRARNEETLRIAHEIRAERILHPESIPAKGREVIETDSNDKSPKVLEWIQTYADWAKNYTNFSDSNIEQTMYLKDRMSDFLNEVNKPNITLRKFDKKMFKAFFRWLKNDYVPQKYVRIAPKPLTPGTLRNIQQRLVAVFNKATRLGIIRVNPFYQLEKEDCFPKPTVSHKQFLTPEELKRFMSSDEKSPGVHETQLAFGFACLTGLRISDIRALKWSDIRKDNDQNILIIVQRKTQTINSVPICPTAMDWMPERHKDNSVFHLPAHANVDAAVKRIAKKVGIEKPISFHTARHTFGTLIQLATADIETTKSLMGHSSLKSTVIYADVMIAEKVKAIANTNGVFRSRRPNIENMTIPKTKRTAATLNHPRRVVKHDK